MLSRSCRPHGCRLCMAHARVLATALATTSRATARVALRPLAMGIRLYSPLPTYEPDDGRPWQEPPIRGHNIRDLLRQWEAENEAQGSENLPADLPPDGDLTNNLTRTQSTGAQGLVTISNRDAELSQPLLGEGHHEDVALATSASDSRIPGNLVELRSAGSRVSNLAIFLGYFGGCNHFYTVGGTWMLSMGFPAAFTVTRFVPFDDLRPLLSKIPANATPEVYFDMQARNLGPTRADGETLMNLMADFRTEANVIYCRHIAELDNIQATAPRSSNVEYLSLVEIAGRLLPLSMRQDDGSFPPPVLYAIFKALSNQDIGCSSFNTSSDCRRPDHLFEIFPQNYAVTVEKVTSMVREYVTEVMLKKPSGEASAMPKNVHMLTIPLVTFIKEARHAVLESRRHRQPSISGIIEPSSGVTLSKTTFSATSREVLQFLEWWACYNLFAPGCRYHSYGAIILRALELYPDRDLNQSTVWLFFQEAGILNPWELPSRFKFRLPGVSIDKSGGLSRATPNILEDSMRPDVAAGHRIERPGETVFCIDAASTSLIDDGVSLQHTERPNEFWIHIHVADPASSIKPDSELARFAELVPENIYLPGHFEPMIPGDLKHKPTDSTSESLVKQFSLRTGAPALTFSAKVNRGGDILESKIEPCTLGNVVLLDPRDVAEFCDEPPPPPDDTVNTRLAVGTFVDSPFPPRQMAATGDLSSQQKNDLLTLYKLAQAIRLKRLSKGAWPYYFPKPSVSVGLEASADRRSSPQGTKIVPADPYIEVGVDPFQGCSVVSNLMVLAGEVAARWCSSRGIPIPYRKNTKSADHLEDAYEYATEVLYPLVRRGMRPTTQQRNEFQKLTGEIEVSSKPGPYFIMGLDMYTKATSPLRRFSDMLVHWQIHAAMAFEREAGRRLDQAKDDLASVLPFTASGLKLSWLKMREKTARRMATGSLDWTLIALLRAWRFERKDLGKMTFKVTAQWFRGLMGRLDLFNLPARLDIEGLDGCRLLKKTSIGDEFEVELTDVNVYDRFVAVKALRFLGGGQATA
ncbi:hypothetical protein XA68_16856 [Ophiocordyceps unilateralis]|uniref:RNB domain-containing protein n=1 Tax=Ophiocordyceps unilateralis TaxID=268505 RepID=A0A2A9P5S7_OPHUN|nr:hypothetical protein XA68_16856 [Ophiocordyceps unilateralis]